MEWLNHKMVIALILNASVFSCGTYYPGLTSPVVKNEAKKENYILTKDGQVHKFSGIGEKSPISNNYFIISESEKYRYDDVKAYSVDGNEYLNINGVMSKKVIYGRINVYLRTTHDRSGKDANLYVNNQYYVQKGENNKLIRLVRPDPNKEIYEMIQDFSPSKTLWEKNMNNKENISMEKVFEAIKVYNSM